MEKERITTKVTEHLSPNKSGKELIKDITRKIPLYPSFGDKAFEKDSDSIKDTLKQRGNKYGEFKTHAELSQNLQAILFSVKPRKEMPSYINEALTLICHKLARIINGDHMYEDNFRDIAGYSQLVLDILKERK